MILIIFFSLPPAFVFSKSPLPTYPIPEGNLSPHGLWRLLEKASISEERLWPCIYSTSIAWFC